MTGTIWPGSDGISSRLVLGTMTFGDTVDAGTAATMLDAAEAGVIAVDTANVYAGGATEEILGTLLPSRRNRVVLATKAGMPDRDAGAHSPLSARGLRASADGSLRRLGVDRIDLFYLHQPDRTVPFSETVRTVAELLAAGKVRAWGVSNFAAWQIAEINHLADELGADRPVAAQQLYNLLARRVEVEYSEFAAVTGLHTVVYNPLCGGLLSGRHRFRQEPADGRFGDSRLAETYRKRYWNATLFEAVDRLADIADQAGLSLPELSLRWVLSKPTADAVLLGASKVDHVRANLDAAASGVLPEDVVEKCDEVGTLLDGPAPAYNR